MATLDEQIAALQDAIAQGARRVIFRSGGTYREVEYHSLAEMQKALLALKASNGTGRRVTLASF